MVQVGYTPYLVSKLLTPSRPAALGSVNCIETCTSENNLYLIAKIIVIKPTDNPHYVEANAGCKHFDVFAGPDDSRNVLDAKV